MYDPQIVQTGNGQAGAAAVARGPRHLPVQARARERVRQILAATAELLGVRGIDKLSTNRIAKHAGLPVGSVYKYFPDKQSIIMSLYDLYVRELAVQIDSILSDPLTPSRESGYIIDSLYGEWSAFVLSNRLDVLRSYIRSMPGYTNPESTDKPLIDAIERLIVELHPASQDTDSRMKALVILKLAIAFEEAVMMPPEAADAYYHVIRVATNALLQDVQT